MIRTRYRGFLLSHLPTDKWSVSDSLGVVLFLCDSLEEACEMVDDHLGK